MRPAGSWGMVLGALVGVTGIFLPGTLLIFFVIRFWDRLRQYRVVQASLEGVNAVSAGLVCAATFLLYHRRKKMEQLRHFLNLGLVA